VKRRFDDTFRALLISRNYRLYTAGQLVSLCGTWMQTVALGWLVLQMTGSGTSVGLVTAAQYLPVLLLAPLGGVLTDRLDTRTVLVCTQSVSAILAMTLGVLTITGDIRLWMVYALASGLGLLQVVDNPARQLFALQLVGPEHLTNAITLNTVNMNLARIVGPAIGAGVISAIGVGQCFVVNACSFVVVIAALLAMRATEFHAKARAPRARGQVREGLRYVNRTPALRTPLIMMALIGTLAYEFQVSLLLAAKYTFHGDGGTYGLMTSAMGVGAVIGGLVTASRERHGVGTLVSTSALFGIVLLAVAAAPSLPLAVAALVCMGAVNIAFIARANATLQLAADPAMRGRVMALWTVAFMGSTPIGGPIVGWIGEHVGPRWALVTGGLACLVAATYGMRQQRHGTQGTHATTEPWVTASARIA
jgi:MFS family permease